MVTVAVVVVLLRTTSRPGWTGRRIATAPPRWSGRRSRASDTHPRRSHPCVRADGRQCQLGDPPLRAGEAEGLRLHQHPDALPLHARAASADALLPREHGDPGGRAARARRRAPASHDRTWSSAPGASGWDRGTGSRTWFGTTTSAVTSSPTTARSSASAGSCTCCATTSRSIRHRSTASRSRRRRCTPSSTRRRCSATGARRPSGSRLRRRKARSGGQLTLTAVDGTVKISGWAADPATGRPLPRVIAFTADGTVLASAVPGEPRPDVAGLPGLRGGRGLRVPPCRARHRRRGAHGRRASSRRDAGAARRGLERRRDRPPRNRSAGPRPERPGRCDDRRDGGEGSAR